MMRDYKVYFKNWHLLITANAPQKNENFVKVYSGDGEANMFLEDVSILFDERPYGNILLTASKPGEVMCKLLDKANIVIAGGGIVLNERNEVLMIHRRGHWDMAKGKIELEEKIQDGAAREVEEETGVKVSEVNPVPIRTYHAYTLKGKESIKETSWYEMKAAPGQDKLIPQAEEDIIDVRWVKRSDLASYKAESYPMIGDIIDLYAE
jgi:8-oxo-dGTP pyrophosphatase MutT (NUDIX family)